MSRACALREKKIRMAAGLLATGAVLAACGGDVGSAADSDSQEDEVTVDNCGEEIAFPAPAEDIFVNESQMLSNLFALAADDHITAVSGLPDGKQEMLKEVYGDDRIDDLPIVSEEYATVENVVAEKPDTMMAGFGWGYDLESNITPSELEKHDVPGYVSSPTCVTGDKGGTMPPWEAISADITNIGKIVGKEDEAQAKLDDIDNRRDELSAAPQPDSPPTVFFYDLTGEEVMSAGSLSPSHAVIEAAGARHALEHLEKDFTKVSWEQLAADEPDFFLISDYGSNENSFENKVNDLKTNPATRDLPAVENDYFIRIPIQMLLGTPATIDASEHLRKALEENDLAPESDIDPELELQQQ